MRVLIVLLIAALAVALSVFANENPLAFDDSQFVNDPAVIRHLNSQQKSWVAGANKVFEGMRVHAARTRHLGAWGLKRAIDRFGSLYTPEQLETLRNKGVDASLPDSFDARQQWGSCVHPIRDQAHCGSCWAFSASEVLSDRFCIASQNKTNVVLSPQDLVSCDTSDMGCNGGMLPNVWQRMSQFGIVPDACLPYVSGDGQVPACPTTCTGTGQYAGKALTAERYKAKNYAHIGSVLLFWERVEKIQKDLMNNGPIQVAFSVYRDFLNYKSGVYHHTSGDLLGGHAVKLVGWGKTQDGDKYWIIANSWTVNWGMDGFFWIRRGHDECGIESNAFSGEPDLGSVPSN